MFRGQLSHEELVSELLCWQDDIKQLLDATTVERPYSKTTDDITLLKINRIRREADELLLKAHAEPLNIPTEEPTLITPEITGGTVIEVKTEHTDDDPFNPEKSIQDQIIDELNKPNPRVE